MRDPKVRSETTKIFEENVGSDLCDISLSPFLDESLEAMETKEK